MPEEIPESELPPEFPIRAVGDNRTLLQILEANKEYAASFGEKGKLTGAPRRKMAILTCMDARMDPAKFTGIEEGDSHVIRNAGGRASDDAIRSLVVSCKLMGTVDWFVIHHSSCGMQAYTDSDIEHLLGLDEDNDDHHENTKWHHVRKAARVVGHLEWLTFKDLAQSIIDDVQTIRNHPLVPSWVNIYGYIYDIHNGTLEAVNEANAIGKGQAKS